MESKAGYSKLASVSIKKANYLKIDNVTVVLIVFSQQTELMITSQV